VIVSFLKKRKLQIESSYAMEEDREEALLTKSFGFTICTHYLDFTFYTFCEVQLRKISKVLMKI